MAYFSGWLVKSGVLFTLSSFGHLRSVRLLKTLLTSFSFGPLTASFIPFPLIDLGDCRFRCIADIGPIML